MAYQVLARKYRPQRFDDVVGQDHVTRTLINALSQNRIAHGYIFSGHRGIGKTTIARILASALNCRNAIGSVERPTPEPCGVCDSCKEIREGNAIDVIEIDAATNRGIDEIRELRDAARYRPSRDQYKIYILDEAHQITDAAFNALLKTLEEPPDHIVFMMATTRPEDIPQTIRSRCQHFSFHAVKFDDILGQLRHIATAEGVKADDASLSLLAEAGDGSMRDALSIMDQAIASAPIEAGRAVLDAAQIRDLMGAVPNAVFEEMLEAVAGNRSADVILVANRLLDAGNSPSQLARQLVHYLRNALIAKIAGGLPDGGNDGTAAELLQISPDERRRAARSALLFQEEELTRFLQVMLRTFDDLGFRQEQRFHFELGLMKLVHLQRLLPIEQLLSQMPVRTAATSSRPQGNTERAAVPPPPRSSPPVAASAPAQTTPRSPSLFETDRSRKQPTEYGRAGIDAAELSPPELTTGALALFVEPTGQRRSAENSTSTPEPAGDGLRLVKPAPTADLSAEALQQHVVAALAAVKGQQSAASQIEESDWAIDENVLRIQTTLSKTLLSVVLNAEAEKVLRNTLREHRAGHLKLQLEPGIAASASPKKAARTFAGSVQTRAAEHPIVQQAQKLFNAEIRNVIDLRGKD